MEKTTYKKAVNSDAGDGDNGGDGGGGSLFNRFKKTKTNNVPHIVTSHAQ